MKVRVQKDSFLKGWLVAERCVATSDTLPTLTAILCNFNSEYITMESTDLKTSVRWKIPVSSLESMEKFQILVPAKAMGELLRKIPGNYFDLEVKDDKIIIQSERSRYRLTTFPPDSFPRLPNSQGATPLGIFSAEELRRLLEKGTFAGSPNEEFPQFVAGACFDINGSSVAVVTTDTRRLALDRGTISREEEDRKQIIVPLRGLRELQKTIAGCDLDEAISFSMDDAQAYFGLSSGEFSIRRIATNFPSYENLINSPRSIDVVVQKNAMVDALERLDVVVRGHNRVVILDFSESQGCIMTGQSPDVGIATEALEAPMTGPNIRIAFNSRLLLDGIKIIDGSLVRMTFNSPGEHLLISNPEDSGYCYIVMPVTLPDEDRGAPSDENYQVVNDIKNKESFPSKKDE
ncbi:MAG TPA: DNA polymerase III subunit beta [Synergistaceae bacterium]|nr:DNA polymerase III subunit beta [Synergistaceae bacterium]